MTERSHPPTLLTLLKQVIKHETRVARGQKILVAVSGGRDSMALLHALAFLSKRDGYELCAHGVDHGLRAEAAAELALGASLARTLEVPFSVSSLRVEAGGNLQARAREARYQALEAARRIFGADWIATAHHARDRAETVLLRLLRGASPRGLAVLSPMTSQLLRPMIRAPEEAIDAHVRRHEISFAQDPSNRDRRFLRTRVRFELLPLLEELSPGVVGHLTALADSLALPELPALFDETGERVLLGRAHVAQLRRLLEARRPRQTVRLPGSREIRLDPASGRPEIVRRQKRASR